MRRTNLLVVYAVLMMLNTLSSTSLADSPLTQGEFEKRLYQPITISTLGVGADRFRALSTTRRKDLLDARVVVVHFFQHLERRDGNPSRHLIQGQNTRPREEIRRSLVADETTVLQMGVSDFKFDETGKRLNLGVYLLLFSEGMLVANEVNAVMEKQSGVWKISQVTKK